MEAPRKVVLELPPCISEESQVNFETRLEETGVVEIAQICFEGAA